MCSCACTLISNQGQIPHPFLPPSPRLCVLLAQPVFACTQAPSNHTRTLKTICTSAHLHMFEKQKTKPNMPREKGKSTAAEVPAPFSLASFSPYRETLLRPRYPTLARAAAPRMDSISKTSCSHGQRAKQRSKGAASLREATSAIACIFPAIV